MKCVTLFLLVNNAQDIKYISYNRTYLAHPPTAINKVLKFCHNGIDDKFNVRTLYKNNIFLGHLSKLM